MMCSKIIFAIILSLAALLTASFSPAADLPGLVISTPEQLKTEFESVPCQNEERASAVRALFEKMGASPSDISLDKHNNVENLVLVKPGTSTGKLVIGAHYDKVSEGCGAVDNWTGIVALAHLYRSFKDVPLKKTVLFVAFGKEEKGLVGSRAMVGSIDKEQAADYCEMINMDSLGMTTPQVADNMSSKKLEELAAGLAARMKIPFAHAAITGADADSSSFIRKGIPALTIHGLSRDWPTILHSRNDQPSKVNPVSVYLGYRLALAVAATADEAACGAYR